MMKLRPTLIALALAFCGAAAGVEAKTQKGMPPKVTPDGCELPGARIFVAAGRGDAKEVRRLLNCGVSPEHDWKGTPLLVHAARAGHTEVARVLLDAGARADGRDVNQHTALFYAAGGGRGELVELLLARGADANARGHEDHTALMSLVQGAIDANLPPALREVRRRLDDKKDDPSVPKSPGSPEDYRRVLRRLVAAGADVKVVAGCGESALSFAPLTGDVELVKTLLAAGTRVDYGISPLCVAVHAEQFMESLTDDDVLGGIDDEKLLDEAEREAAEWPARSAASRREMIALLEAAGATRHDCDDEDKADDKE